MYVTNWGLVVVRRMTADFHLHVVSVLSVLLLQPQILLKKAAHGAKLQLPAGCKHHFLNRNQPEKCFFFPRLSCLPFLLLLCPLYCDHFFISLCHPSSLFPAQCSGWQQRPWQHKATSGPMSTVIYHTEVYVRVEASVHKQNSFS